MHKRLFTTIVLLLMHIICLSQVMPADNAILNYRLAGFSVQQSSEAVEYLFEIVADSVADEVAFNNATKCIYHKNNEHNTIVMLPSFGTKYTWRASYINDYNEIVYKTPLHYFATGKTKAADTTKTRLKILKEPSDHKDLYVVVDYAMALYDLSGSPIWYLPDIPEVANKGLQLRDLKPTPDGTFTAVTTQGGYEFDYNGRVLWLAPNDGKVSGDTTEYYHHELTKLSNGHYMIAGSEYIWCKIPANRDVYVVADDKDVKQREDGNYYKRIISGTLIEYDEKGNVVWNWKASSHFTDKDYFRPIKATVKPFNSDTHFNGFEVDEKNRVIYLSFRDLNRIVKIQYPSGKILNNYGEVINNDLSIQPGSPFYGQHSCRINKRNDNLYVFNNNTGDSKEMQKEQEAVNCSHLCEFNINKSGGLDKVWDFPCITDRQSMPVTITGGSINILDDDCILTSMGSANRVFIVNKGKQIVWDALPQVSDVNNNWIGLGPYRVNYIHMPDMGKFIFRK